MKPSIEQFSPCSTGLEYYNSCPSFESAWDQCERGNWMLWMASKLKVDKRVLTLAKGLCANTVRHLMKDERSIAAVDAAIAYGRGEIDDDKLEKAAAYAFVAFVATYAAAYAAYAAVDADAVAAENRKQTADICRQVLTEAVMEKVKELNEL